MNVLMDNKVKRMWAFLICLCCYFTLSAQNISVKSFRSDLSDLSARSNPVKNENAQNCALLKIITTETGFSFEPDAMGICKDVEYKNGAAEIWLWLSPGSRRLTIAHPQLGQLRNYEYPEAINPSTVYVMELTTAKITTVIEEQNKQNYLRLSVSPIDAIVKIDGNVVVTNNGQYAKMLAVGKHTCECYCSLFHSQTMDFSINPDEKTSLNINLKPNYGYIKVTSSPESGAAVFIEGRQVGTTPYTSDKLESKTYTVLVAKEMWQEEAKQIVVADSQTVTSDFILTPNFAEPTITCADTVAEIWINGEQKGQGHWSGRLSAGAYKIEAKKKSHTTSVKQLTLKNGDKTTITISAPVPIYGKLDVNSEPFDADIIMDGEKIGTTPEFFNNVLVGSHEVKLQKSGYATVTQTVTLIEGETTTIEEKLSIMNEILTLPPKDGDSCGTVEDYDGNVYGTVQIGQQCWMKENLRAAHYADGKNIVLVSKTSSTTIAYRYLPNNNINYVVMYGYLYNWPAVVGENSSPENDLTVVQGICPNGWHVPSDAEWKQLADYVGSQNQYVHKNNNKFIAKALSSTMGWKNSSDEAAIGRNKSSNNATHFSALPAGIYFNTFYDFGSLTCFWSSTKADNTNAYYRYLYYSYPIMARGVNGMERGFSVRCVRD